VHRSFGPLIADLQDDKGLGPLFAAKSVESLSERHWGTPVAKIAIISGARFARIERLRRDR
jgi:hypothetical protein